MAKAPAKLNQIIAIEKGVKSRAYSVLSDLNKAVQKATIFNGFHKSYQPLDAEGKALPPESQVVQATVGDVLTMVRKDMSELFNVETRKDYTNCVAKADVVVNGHAILTGAPVSLLLFFEKQLTDLRTFVGNLPVLDPTEKWEFDENSGYFVTPGTKSHRTEKEQVPIVLYDATDKHPAQTQLITKDEIVGYWMTTKQSGAMSKPYRMAMLERIEKLLAAVKMAREDANMQEEVPTDDVGERFFDYLFMME